MSYSMFIQAYLINLHSKFEELSNRFSLISGKKVLSSHFSLLRKYLEARYLDGYQTMTVAEFLQSAQRKSLPEDFKELLNQLVFSPFRKMVSKCDKASFCEIHKTLNTTIYAIDLAALIQMVGDENDKSLHYLFDLYSLSLIKYRFRSFKDEELESLYSNDDLNLMTQKAKSIVNHFFRFFIDGDGKEGKYNPESYYGCMPVSEERIKVYCKSEGIPIEYVDKLLSIARNSKRFVIKDNNGHKEYSLKLQYITGTEAMAAAILYKAGREKPMTKEQLYAQIEKIHTQYPRLVDSTKGNSWHPARKPILCSAGKKDLWTLEIWRANKGDVLHDIREFVSNEYSKTGKPIHFDRIYEYLLSLGYTYPKDTLRKSYIPRSGCKNVRNGLFLPSDSDVIETGRYWRNKQYLLQRIIAELLYTSKTPLSRTEIIERINENFHSVSKNTLNKALIARRDLFQLIGITTSQKIRLTDKIHLKKDISIQIPKPETKELPYITAIRSDIISYLLKNEDKDVFQSELVTLFLDKVPTYLKSCESTIRGIIKEEKYFVKETLGDKLTKVTLNPTFRKKIELERQQEPKVSLPSPQFNTFSWEGLREGIMRQILKDDQDKIISKRLDEVFCIFRSGRDEFLPNSNFKDIVYELFKYVTGSTTPKERRDLQENMLSMMEAYFKEFYRLSYGDDLSDMMGLGEIRYFFQDQGILPNKEKNYLEKSEYEIARIMESVNKQRNKVQGHKTPLSDQSDKQAINDIHNCLSLMVYVVGKKK